LELTRVSLYVPGRLEIVGKHTDYAGGRSLVAAVPRGITINADCAGGRRVVIRDLSSGDQLEFSTRGDGEGEGWRRYPRTVVQRLAKDFPQADLSVNLSFTSDLPQAAGMSSSSALIIGIAEALIACAKIDELPEWRSIIRTPEDRASYFGCIESGASFGPLAGDAGVGTHGGSEDHAAIVMSRANEMRQFSYAPMHLDRVIAMPSGWIFVIVSSGVAAHKTGSANAAYNRLSAMVRDIVAGFQSEQPGGPRSLAALVRAGDAQAMRLAPELRTRLDHFIAEDARVGAAADAFSRADVAAIGELARASQMDADRLLDNQVDETRYLASVAYEIGATAASSFGAGWGGSVWALVRTIDAEPFLDEWLAAYRRRHPSLRSSGFVSSPADGLRRIASRISP
jgi:galactokinase